MALGNINTTPEGYGFLGLLYGRNAGFSNLRASSCPSTTALYDQSRALPDGPARTRAVPRDVRDRHRLRAVGAASRIATRTSSCSRGCVGYKYNPTYQYPFPYLDIDLPRRDGWQDALRRQRAPRSTLTVAGGIPKRPPLQRCTARRRIDAQSDIHSRTTPDEPHPSFSHLPAAAARLRVRAGSHCGIPARSRHRLRSDRSFASTALAPAGLPAGVNGGNRNQYGVTSFPDSPPAAVIPSAAIALRVRAHSCRARVTGVQSWTRLQRYLRRTISTGSGARRISAKLWTSLTITAFGAQITNLALPLTAALLLHATPLQMGVLVALETLPFALVSLHAGVLLDRVRKLPIVIASDVGRGVALLAIPIAAFTRRAVDRDPVRRRLLLRRAERRRRRRVPGAARADGRAASGWSRRTPRSRSARRRRR